MTTITPVFQQCRATEQMLARCIGRLNRFKALGLPDVQQMQRLVKERDALKTKLDELTRKMTARQ